jgi:3-methyladenine DNA glycosylase AlkD
MHKACGWMLREVGKRDVKPLLAFLDQHAAKMPRTLLRYAIEKLPEETRQAYLTIKG